LEAETQEMIDLEKPRLHHQNVGIRENRYGTALGINKRRPGCDNQPPPTRCGTVKEYSRTTAPTPSRLQGAQSGGTSSCADIEKVFELDFNTAFSRINDSMPSKQE
jgi:hypothetical protein